MRGSTILQVMLLLENYMIYNLLIQNARSVNVIYMIYNLLILVSKLTRKSLSYVKKIIYSLELNSFYGLKRFC